MMAVEEKAKKVKLLLLDIDGVLTDGKIVIGNYGDEIKNFDVNDGLGIMLVKRAGIKCAIITAQKSRVVKIRASQLKIDKVYYNHYKIKLLNRIKRNFRVKEEEICYIGDDLIDIPILKRVGFSVTVPHATEEVKRYVHYITTKHGGSGAVREICEIILKAQGLWHSVIGRYLE